MSRRVIVVCQEEVSLWSATLFCVTEIVSSFETHHTFGVPKRLALKALQKAFFYGQLLRAQR